MDDKTLNGIPTKAREDLERFLPEGRSLGDLPTELVDELYGVQFTSQEIISERFEIIEQLGFGGMGAVYKVKDLLIRGQLKALKMMLPSLVRSQEARERFISEAEIAQSLRHEGIATVYDIGMHRDILFLTMELLEGQSLDKYLKSKGGRLGFLEAVDMVLKICEGLAYAHKKGVIHRDIKPQNIFVLSDGKVKLLDFGLAKLLSPGRLTRSSVGLGTAYYMSPEQSMGKEVSERSDIFSVGVVLYQMLVGRIPMGRFKLPSTLDRSIPSSIDSIIEKCLDEQPEERYHRVEDLVSDIERVRSAYEKEEKERVEKEQRAIAEKKQKIDSLFKKGKSALDRNSFAEALGAFNEILLIDSENQEARELVDRVTAEKARFEERKRIEEERRKAEELKRKEEERLRREAEEAERRRREEEKKKEEEEKRRLEKLRRHEEEERLRIEEEKRREEEQKRREAEEAKRKLKTFSIISAELLVVIIAIYFGLRQKQVTPRSPVPEKPAEVPVAPPPRPQPEKPKSEVKPSEAPSTETKAATSAPRPGERYTDPLTGMEFVWVPGGRFDMGDTFGDGDEDEKPIHEVVVNGFWIGKYEVTQGQWQKVMGNNPSYFKKGDDYPVEQVSWNDIQEFIQRLNQKTGKKYRLPTEAEWEYAARSGGKREKWAGTRSESELGEYAWYDKNSGGSTHPVGQKKPNGLGLYDLSGNVWEWCEDWYGEDYYRSSPRDNPRGPNSGQYKVLRGGSWNYDTGGVRASNRDRFSPADRFSLGNGFRLVLPSR